MGDNVAASVSVGVYGAVTMHGSLMRSTWSGDSGP